MNTINNAALRANFTTHLLPARPTGAVTGPAAETGEATDAPVSGSRDGIEDGAPAGFWSRLDTWKKQRIKGAAFDGLWLASLSAMAATGNIILLVGGMGIQHLGPMIFDGITGRSAFGDCDAVTLSHTVRTACAMSLGLVLGPWGVAASGVLGALLGAATEWGNEAMLRGNEG